MFPQITHLYCCRICGELVDLKTCKTDEHGITVHEACYVATIALASESMKPPRLLPLRVELRVWD